MKKQFLEAGKIVNTHGVRGDIKIQPWTSAPDFLLDFDRIFIDGQPIAIHNIRVQKGCVIASLENINDLDSAIRLKNKVIYINRDDASLADGEHFVQDIIGLAAVDFDTGKEIGTISDIISLPASDVYVISSEREILIPAVPEFVREIDIPHGCVRFHLIVGM
jgi:16S rRNA processing protein RimM